MAKFRVTLKVKAGLGYSLHWAGEPIVSGKVVQGDFGAVYHVINGFMKQFTFSGNTVGVDLQNMVQLTKESMLQNFWRHFNNHLDIDDFEYCSRGVSVGNTGCYIDIVIEKLS